MILKDGLLLYHGSYTPVEQIDLQKCAAGKDFGKGFYLTANKQQAENFIKTSLLKAKSYNLIDLQQSFGYVTCYKYHQPLANLATYTFADADKEWLWFIALNRRYKLAQELLKKINKGLFSKDVIIGKIANDTTNPVITAYLNGLYGPLINDSSANMAISLLLPNRLKEQYCFLTQKAVDCLQVMEVTTHEF